MSQDSDKRIGAKEKEANIRRMYETLDAHGVQQEDRHVLEPGVLPQLQKHLYGMPIDETTAIADILNEVKRARTLYPRRFINMHEAHSIIREEFQEVENITYVKHQNRNPAKLRNELVQLAAMCIRALTEVDANDP